MTRAFLIAAMLALASLTSGCAGAAQKAAIRDAVKSLRPVVNDLEDRANATQAERMANEKQLSAIEDAAK